MKLRPLLAVTITMITPAYASGGDNTDVGVGVTTNTTNQLISPPGGRGGRGPVAPAYSPTIEGGSLGTPGEARVSLRTQNVCGVYDHSGRLKDVLVLNSSMEVVEPSRVKQRGVSAGLSLFKVGFSGGVSTADITPSDPHSRSGEYFLELEASQIVSCEAVGNPHLRKERVEQALRTLNVLRRGRLEGMAASETIQLHKEALPPNMTPAPPRKSKPAVRGLW